MENKEGMAAVEAYINSLEDGPKAISQALHKLILDTLPGTQAMLYHGYPGYCASAGPKQRFCYIAAQSNWVNLGFYYGAGLPDPEGLLEGTGKSMRHIKVRQAADTTRPGLKPLIAAARDKAVQGNK